MGYTIFNPAKSMLGLSHVDKLYQILSPLLIPFNITYLCFEIGKSLFYLKNF